MKCWQARCIEGRPWALQLHSGAEWRMSGITSTNSVRLSLYVPVDASDTTGPSPCVDASIFKWKSLQSEVEILQGMSKSPTWTSFRLPFSGSRSTFPTVKALLLSHAIVTPFHIHVNTSRKQLFWKGLSTLVLPTYVRYSDTARILILDHNAFHFIKFSNAWKMHKILAKLDF